MKSAYLVLLIFIITVGCATVSKVYLDISSDSENYIKETEVFRLTFSANNPTEYTFTGSLEYQYNEKCLRLEDFNNEEIVEVLPRANQATKHTLIREFEYIDKDNRARNSEQLDIECKQTPHKITIFLKDKSGAVKDSKSVMLTIAD